MSNLSNESADVLKFARPAVVAAARSLLSPLPEAGVLNTVIENFETGSVPIVDFKDLGRHVSSYLGKKLPLISSNVENMRAVSLFLGISLGVVERSGEENLKVLYGSLSRLVNEFPGADIAQDTK